MAAEGQGRQSRYLGPVAPDAGARRQYSFSRLTGKLHARATGSEPSSLDERRLAGAATGRPGPGHAGTRGAGRGRFCPAGRRCRFGAASCRRAGRRWPGPQRTRRAELISRFLASPRAAAIAAAEKAYRELEFLLAWPPAGEQTGSGADVPEPPARYLQGFIDCLYCDAEGQWRLVDYKTNRVTADTLPAVAGNYEMQMLVYALAAETDPETPAGRIGALFSSSRSGISFCLGCGRPAARAGVGGSALP